MDISVSYKQAEGHQKTVALIKQLSIELTLAFLLLMYFSFLKKKGKKKRKEERKERWKEGREGGRKKGRKERRKIKSNKNSKKSLGSSPVNSHDPQDPQARTSTRISPLILTTTCPFLGFLPYNAATK